MDNSDTYFAYLFTLFFFLQIINLIELKIKLNLAIILLVPHRLPQISPLSVLQTQVLWLSWYLDIMVDMNKLLTYNTVLLMNSRYGLHRTFHNIIGRPTYYQDYRVTHGMNWECLPAIRLFEVPYRCTKNDNK
jgi:hypothetical protein